MSPTAWANLRTRAADGTLLAHDAHLPEESQWPVPVVLTRTAYGRGVHLAEGRSWRREGFAFVAQDVRGRYDSDGTWRPYRGERADGAALVDHVLAQPWCDGRVVAYGGSYSGFTAWSMAVERPSAVRAVISLGPSLGLHRTKFAPGGLLRLVEHVGWWLERADGRVSHPGLRETVLSEDPGLLDHLPVVDIGRRTGVDLPHWHDALDLHAEFGRDGTPPEALTHAELRSLDCPVLHAGGWYDLLAPDVVGLWEEVGSGLDPRPARTLVLGPWEHDLGMAGRTTTGLLDHGPGSRRAWGAEFVAFARSALAGTASTAAHVFRDGRWVTSPEWPTGSRRAWFPGADGVLGRQSVPGTVGFRHEPVDPFPSVPPGCDRSPTAARSDAVRFWTDPLPRALSLDGTPELDLDVSASGPVADWICRLLHARADGTVLEIASASASSVGDGPCRVSAEFTPLSVRLPAGDRLGLEVTGSDFPFLARNLGTGADRLRSRATATVDQVVQCGPGRTLLRLPELRLPEGDV